jgi:hypothetical protein
VNALSSKIKLLSFIFEEVVDRIFECEKISIVAYIDTFQQVSTSGSGSLTVCAMFSCFVCLLRVSCVSNVYLHLEVVR